VNEQNKIALIVGTPVMTRLLQESMYSVTFHRIFNHPDTPNFEISHKVLPIFHLFEMEELNFHC